MECTNVLQTNRSYNSDCTGGYTDFALGVVKTYGLPLESAWPYKASAYGSVAGAPSSPGICSTNQTFILYDVATMGAKTPMNLTRYDNITVTQM